MTKELNPTVDEDQRLINFSLKCLEIAVHILGPIEYDPDKSLTQINLNQYIYVHNLIVKMVTSVPAGEDDPSAKHPEAATSP